MSSSDHQPRSFDIDQEVERFFDDSSIATTNPEAVIIMGGVAVGKTTIRKKNYSVGYVLIDAAEIFHRLSHGDSTLDFPDHFQRPLEMIGRMVTLRALSERRNIVTEIVGHKATQTSKLIDVLNKLGYKVKMITVTCDLHEALRRNETRGDNVSAYYAEQFQYMWIIEVGTKLLVKTDRPKKRSVPDFIRRFMSYLLRRKKGDGAMPPLFSIVVGPR